jgi:hypothetical protein
MPADQTAPGWRAAQDEESVKPSYFNWGITLPGVQLEPDNRLGQEFCAGANATEVSALS